MTTLTDRLARLVLDAPRGKFLAVLFAFMFARTGMTWVAPALLPIAKDPFHNPFSNPYEHYLFWSWLGPFVAHTIGATTAFRFTLFYLVFSIGFTALMVRWMFTRLDEPLARVAVLVFALLPGSATPYYWIFTDSLTLFLFACTLYVPRNYPVLVVLGIALGMQHFEQALFGAGAAMVVLAWSARRGGQAAYTWRWAAAIVVGAVLGKITLYLIFHHYDIHVNSGRWFWLKKGWRMMLRRFFYSYHFALFSTFAVGWLAVVRLLGRRGPEALPLGLAIGGLLLLMPISDDPTRVFAVVSFPLACVYLLGNREFLATIDRSTVGRWALLWCLVPFMFVWSGKPIVSAFAYDLYQLWQWIFHTTRAPLDPRFPL